MFSVKLLTSSSVYEYPHVLMCDLRHIYECARVCKQKLICIDGSNGIMYATNEEPCGIHEIKLPFVCNTDLLLNYSLMDKEILAKYEEFFIPEQFNWAIVPVYYWDMYRAGDIIKQYDVDSDIIQLLDKTTMKPIECIYRYKATQDMLMNNFIYVLSDFLNRRSRCIIRSKVNDLHLDPAFQNGFFNQKSVFGDFYINVNCGDRQQILTFYKGIISLNKSDKLDLELYEDGYMRGIYMAVLIPKKKKDPITGNKYGIPFSEKAYFCYKGI